MYNKGTRYLEKLEFKKALKCFLAMERTHAFQELFINTGNAYRGLGIPGRAISYYRKALDVPDSQGGDATRYVALNNLGLMAYYLGDCPTAISYYKASLALEPLHREAIFNLGVAKLKDSNCTLGWEEYTYRPKNPCMDRLVSSKEICVISEQGAGDKIMFSRYMPLLLSKYSRVYVVGHPSLAMFFPECTYISDVDSVPLVPRVALCSLALEFGVIGPPPSTWNGGSNIGVCFSGSSSHANDSNRSCPGYYFKKFNGVNLNPAANFPGIPSLGSKTWEETAAYVKNCRYVVTVDTSIAHLAGSIGVPTFMIQPLYDTDFRWGCPWHTNVWYPSVIVIQNNSWEESTSCIKQLTEDMGL